MSEMTSGVVLLMPIEPVRSPASFGVDCEPSGVWNAPKYSPGRMLLNLLDVTPVQVALVHPESTIQSTCVSRILPLSNAFAGNFLEEKT